MSYARFSSDSDVYVYQSFDVWCCCACKLGDSEYFNTLIELKRHLEKHIAAGHKVPDYCLERIEYEIETGKSHMRDIVAPDIPQNKISPPEWN